MDVTAGPAARALSFSFFRAVFLFETMRPERNLPAGQQNLESPGLRYENQNWDE